MTHATIHFAVGFFLGTAVALPGLLRNLRAGKKLASHFAIWLGLSYGVGILAVTPGMLRNMGIPDAICDGWWMNVFVGYPVIHRFDLGGPPSGILAILICFGTQYGSLLLALCRLNGREDHVNTLTDDATPGSN